MGDRGPYAAGSAGAESRVWTALSGSTVEAEWTGEEAGKVLLRNADGKVLGIALNSLSEADQRMCAASVPRNLSPPLEPSPSQPPPTS